MLLEVYFMAEENRVMEQLNFFVSIFVDSV